MNINASSSQNRTNIDEIEMAYRNRDIFEIYVSLIGFYYGAFILQLYFWIPAENPIFSQYRTSFSNTVKKKK